MSRSFKNEKHYFSNWKINKRHTHLTHIYSFNDKGETEMQWEVKCFFQQINLLSIGCPYEKTEFWFIPHIIEEFQMYYKYKYENIVSKWKHWKIFLGKDFLNGITIKY